MALGKKKTLAAQLAELSNPAPVDIDPEEFGETFRTYGFDPSDEDEGNDEVKDGIDLGRDHYVSVGKSSLRRDLFILNDPKYVGKRSSRKDIFENYFDHDEGNDDVEMKSKQNFEDDDEDDDEDEDDGEDDDEVMNDKNSDKNGDKKDDLDQDESEDESDENDNIEGNISLPFNVESENQKSSDFENKDNVVSLENVSSVQEELRKIEDDERNLLHKMKQNAQEDISKGHHVKTQLGLWDTFLDTRIHLQKAVSIANSFPQSDVYSEFLTPESELAVQKTRAELRELVDSLIDLRKDLCHENNSVKEISENTINNRKRHLDDDDEYIEYLWKDIKELHDHFLPYRTQTIEKWNNKVQISSGIPLNKKFKAINQSINTQIEQILYDKERLIKRTQLKRNPYKILGKKDIQEQDVKKHDEHLSNYDDEIFDDMDFYQQLLRELIESRMVDTDDPIALGMQWAAIRQTKQKKKQVDTKASKGRRLRYHVHEKLQNFMVPIQTGTWHEDMVGELYSSLLGKKYDDDNDSDLDSNNENQGENILEKKENDVTIETSLNDLKIFG